MRAAIQTIRFLLFVPLALLTIALIWGYAITVDQIERHYYRKAFRHGRKMLKSKE